MTLYRYVRDVSMSSLEDGRIYTLSYDFCGGRFTTYGCMYDEKGRCFIRDNGERLQLSQMAAHNYTVVEE